MQLLIRNVTKSYSGSTPIEVLQEINLQVKKGELICILGPSGCGKSTLLNIMAGLDHPTTGEVIDGGKKVTEPSASRILLFQDGALFPWLTVAQNIASGLTINRVPKAIRLEKVRNLLRMMHLEGFEDSYIHQLSGGMRQRVAIARSLAVDPAVLLMDEPFAALDVHTRERMHVELETIWKKTKKTIVFVTHNVREAAVLGDRVIVFSKRPGKILNDYAIDLPRPRRAENRLVIKKADALAKALREGME